MLITFVCLVLEDSGHKVRFTLDRIAGNHTHLHTNSGGNLRGEHGGTSKLHKHMVEAYIKPQPTHIMTTRTPPPHYSPIV